MNMTHPDILYCERTGKRPHEDEVDNDDKQELLYTCQHCNNKKPSEEMTEYDWLCMNCLESALEHDSDWHRTKLQLLLYIKEIVDADDVSYSTLRIVSAMMAYLEGK